VSSIPFGPDYKDPPWRWGSFLIGVAGFVVLAAIATLGGIWLIHWWWFVAVILGLLFSARSGRAWAQGRPPESSFTKKTQPTVAVEGKAGATYVLLEPAKNRVFVKPRDYGPGWWVLYSVVVRAPVAFGDFILTIIWRFASGIWGSSSATARERNLQFDHVDAPGRTRPPDSEKF
jgi:predicted tellurium resistance membrane protein TerC